MIAPTPAERAFLAFVRAHADIGYGRMMQIISHEWYRHDPFGAAVADDCYATLPPKDREAYAHLAEIDPLFKEDTP